MDKLVIVHCEVGHPRSCVWPSLQYWVLFWICVLHG